MIRLEKSQKLGRRIRQDDVADLATPTWTLVRQAIRSGKNDEALDFLDHELSINKTQHDVIITMIEGLFTALASFDEQEVDKFLRRRYTPRIKEWLSLTPGAKESLHRWLEMHRSHFSDFTVTEEPDRYVVKLDPCGSGGRLRRSVNVGLTKKAYPWNWSKPGVPYYCTHCCVSWEVLPTELRGYPIKVAFPGEKPEDPCVHFFYKKPELIPEECFTRIGKTKTIK